MKKIILILCCLCCTQILFAQQNVAPLPSTKNTKKILSYALPATLVSYGIVKQFTPALQNFDKSIDKRIVQNVHRSYSFDDYILFAPYISLYALDWCGVRAKNSFWERSFAVGFAGVATIAVITGVKQISNVERPDKSNSQSFPSMHTALAFVGAHSLFREYQHVSPWIGVAAYAVAATTGSMRMVNRKHWLSDVIAGAGVGILATEASYQLLPLWRSMFRLKERGASASVLPIVSPQFCGLGITLAL